MKKIISVLLVLIMALGTCTVAFAESQTSVPEGYIGIYTAEDLNNIRNNLSGKYILMNDIDLSVYENWEPIGDYENPFWGEINGNNYLIKSLKILKDYSITQNSWFGLFGVVSNAVLTNVAVIDSEINVICNNNTNSNYMLKSGIIAGELRMSDALSCVAQGVININSFVDCYVGGLFGYNVKSNIDICSNYSKVALSIEQGVGNAFLGGITGYINSEEDISQCCNFGSIIILGDTAYERYVCAGGIYGMAYSKFSLADCYNRGEIISDSFSGYCAVGGIAGSASIIKNSYNIGNISVADDFKGFCGGIAGNIKKALVSFPLGEKERFENTYYIDNLLTPGAFDGELYNESLPNSDAYINVNHLSAVQMENQSNFEGYNFETIWSMEENGYPVLKNQPMINVRESVELVEGDVYGDRVIADGWKSSNPDVATVNENGEIVAVGAGEATITVTYAYGYTEEITVTIFEETVDKNTNIFSKIISEVLSVLEIFGVFIVSLFKHVVLIFK